MTRRKTEAKAEVIVLKDVETGNQTMKVVPDKAEDLLLMPDYWPFGINWDDVDMEHVRGVIRTDIVSYVGNKRGPSLTQEEFYRLIYRSIIKALKK